MARFIATDYLKWHLWEMPLEILKGWRNILLFGLNYFSLPLLFKTYFAPWRRVQWSYGRGFDLLRYFETFAGNLISRIIGAAIRTTILLAGVAWEIFVFGAGIAVFILWFLFPLLVASAFLYGFKLF